MVPGVPILAPAIEYLAAVDENLEIAGTIEPESVLPPGTWDDRAFPGHVQSGHRLLHVRRARPSRPAVQVLEILQLDGRFLPRRDRLAARNVGRRPAAAFVDD